jgi:hypothetical protein
VAIRWCATRGCTSKPMPPSETRCQTCIARISGYDPAHISKVLRGKSRPSLEAANRIAGALGMELGAFNRYLDRVKGKP